jgi:hypothetical protein
VCGPLLPNDARDAGIRNPARPVATTKDVSSPDPWPFLSGRCPSSRVFSANTRTAKNIGSIHSIMREVTSCFRCVFIVHFLFTVVNIPGRPSRDIERNFPTILAACCERTICPVESVQDDKCKNLKVADNYFHGDFLPPDEEFSCV